MEKDDGSQSVEKIELHDIGSLLGLSCGVCMQPVPLSAARMRQADGWV